MRRTRICVMATTLIMVVASSCVQSRGPADNQSDITEIIEKEDLTVEASEWADSISAQMDTLELASQVMLPAVFASNDAWTLRLVVQYAHQGMGGIILLKGNAAGAKILADSMQAISKVIPFVAIDAEWGLGMRLEDAPVFPANGLISDDADEQLMYDYGREVAGECRQVGINMVLGPVLDINGSNGIMGKRSFGTNAVRVTNMGIAYGRGLEHGGVISVAKHFPGQGSVKTDTHTGKGIIDRSLHQMDSVDLQPFREWSRGGLSGVMVGHLAVPSIDGKMLPAAVSATVINDLLIEDLGFRGLILTDAMNMGGAEGYGADKALKAGAHLIVAPKDTRCETEGIIKAVRSGEIPINILRERVRHILFYKYLMSMRSPDTKKTIELTTSATDSLYRRLRGK